MLGTRPRVRRPTNHGLPHAHALCMTQDVVRIVYMLPGRHAVVPFITVTLKRTSDYETLAIQVALLSQRGRAMLRACQ